MNDTGYLNSLAELIRHLPSSTTELSNERCPFKSFELGFIHGRHSEEISVGDAVMSLEPSINPHGKSCEASYLKGREIGSKIKGCVDFAEQCSNGTILLPKIRKYKGVDRTPMFYYKINDKFIVSVSAGTLSAYDIIARYWQYDYGNSIWLKSRQPKHIHWAVDLLIKNEYNKDVVSIFIRQLINDWSDRNIIRHIQSQDELSSFLNPEILLKYVFVEAERYSEFDIHGEYPMELLILLSRLLMTQERTNRNDAYMFKKLLDSFNNTYVDFYNVVDIATFRHR